MEQIPEFIGNHPFLMGAFLLVLVMLVKAEYEHQISKAYQLTTTGAIRLMNNEGSLLLDVREPAEYKSAHINDATNVPFSKMQERAAELKAYQDKDVVVYCSTGNQSGKACKLLQQSGFTKVHNIAGGLHSWQDANLPLTKK